MPQTGDECETSGIYRGVCGQQHVKEIALSRGETFPPCHTSKCSGAVTWVLVTATK